MSIEHIEFICIAIMLGCILFLFVFKNKKDTREILELAEKELAKKYPGFSLQRLHRYSNNLEVYSTLAQLGVESPNSYVGVYRVGQYTDEDMGIERPVTVYIAFTEPPVLLETWPEGNGQYAEYVSELLLGKGFPDFFKEGYEEEEDPEPEY